MLKAKLAVVGGDAKSTEVNLKLPCIIGRAKEATLTLPHPLVSRQHCEIYEKNGRLYVKDLGSLNGTFVNNKRIEGEQPLNPNELLTLGNVTFRALYEVSEDAAADKKPVHKHPPIKPVTTGKKTESADAPVLFEPADDETVFEDTGGSASDTDKSLIEKAVAESSEVLSGIDQLPVDADKSVSLSSLDGLPVGPAAASFVGGIDTPDKTPDVTSADAVKIDLGQGEKPKEADDSGLGSFLKKLPK